MDSLSQYAIHIIATYLNTIDIFNWRHTSRRIYHLLPQYSLENFPYDVQDLSIVFDTSTLTIKDAEFVPIHVELERDTFFMVDTTYLSISDWDIVDMRVFYLSS